MKLKRIFLIPLLAILLSGCNSSSGGSNDDKYLKLGESVSTGVFSQKLNELNYIEILSDDPNKTGFEIIFDLHYSGGNVIPLSQYSYKAVFDQNENMGQLSYLKSDRNLPESIAPNQTISIKLAFECFKDWKNVHISYSDKNDSFYSFNLRSSDFEYPVNNLFPTLKANESTTSEDGNLTVCLKNITKMPDEYGYTGKTDDGVIVQIESINNTNNLVEINDLKIKADNGIVFSRIHNTFPSSIKPSKTIRLGIMLVILSKEWNCCTVVLTFNGGDTVAFNFKKTDFNY